MGTDNFKSEQIWSLLQILTAFSTRPFFQDNYNDLYF